MAIGDPVQLWVDSSATPTWVGETFTIKVACRITGRPGAQYVIARTWANEAVIHYDDVGDGTAASVWYTDDGATFELGVMASRPALNAVAIRYVTNRGSNVVAGWSLQTAPNTWVRGTTANPLPSHGSDRSYNLGSNVNGAVMDVQCFCAWDQEMTELQLGNEVYSEAMFRTNLNTEVKLNDGDVTSPWVNTASTGTNNNLTQQAGSAPSNVTNFLADPPAKRFTSPRAAVQRAAFH